MALERIDPFVREDRLCLDHMLRYQWARRYVNGKRVVDVACGTGFGSVLLAHANASQVTGIDSDEETVHDCTKAWDHPNLQFLAGDITRLPDLLETPCDRVVCFETLEHLKEPEAAVAAIAGAMDDGGLLIGSVPAETDVLEENDHHLQVFNEASLQNLLQPRFENIRILTQRFSLSSFIEADPASSAAMVHEAEVPVSRLNFGMESGLTDSYVFLASDAALPEVPPVEAAVSQAAWNRYFTDAQRAFSAAARFQERLRKLFLEQGDLKRRFTNLFAWGQYYHLKATGKTPKGGYLKRIEGAQSKREGELRKEIEVLNAEIKALKDQIRTQLPDRKIETVKNRARFIESLNNDAGE